MHSAPLAYAGQAQVSEKQPPVWGALPTKLDRETKPVTTSSKDASTHYVTLTAYPCSTQKTRSTSGPLLRKQNADFQKNENDLNQIAYLTSSL